MASELKSGALTSLKRIKDRLTLSTPDFDTLFERLINAASDYVEGASGRIFKEATYNNEVHSVYAPRQVLFLLKQAPVAALTSAQYRAGTPSNPSWTNFLADEYELVGDGTSGIVKIYGGIRSGINTVRFTYTAGYKIDFDNPANPANHTLPFDITDLVERLTVRLFKRRESEGKQTEGFEGSSITWASLIDESDREVINRYRRVQIV